MTKERLVPELRFPEFEGEWKKIKLEDLSYDNSYGMNSSAIEYDGLNKYIRITDIDSITNNYNKNDLVSPKDTLADRYLLEEGDILFARTGASVGKSYYYKKEDGKTYFAGYLIRFRIKEKYNHKFIFYNTLIDKYDKWVKVMSMRSGQPGINASEYSKLEIIMPFRKEQDKIVNFFQSMDKKLELQEETIKELKSYKKAMIQRIFDQELRFKDENGEKYPEWEEIKLGEIVNLQGGYAFKSQDYKNKGIPIIRISNIQETINISKNIVYTDNQKISSDYIIERGDLLIAMSGATTGKVGIYNHNKRSYLNQRCGKFIVKKKIYYPYLYSWVESECFSKQLRTRLIAGAQPNISAEDIESMVINLPQKEEQKKIAKFMLSISNNIELKETKLKKYKELKKGLMQRMFI